MSHAVTSIVLEHSIQKALLVGKITCALTTCPRIPKKLSDVITLNIPKVYNIAENGMLYASLIFNFCHMRFGCLWRDTLSCIQILRIKQLVNY